MVRHPPGGVEGAGLRNKVRAAPYQAARRRSRISASVTGLGSTQVDGPTVPTLDDYLVAIRSKKAGETVRIQYIRNGASQTVSVPVVDVSTLNLTP
jgi:S1-C subfamily serine protease